VYARLPAAKRGSAEELEAAARIGALYCIILLQRRYTILPGKAKRPQALLLTQESHLGGDR
jgi:hypothetical protein